MRDSVLMSQNIVRTCESDCSLQRHFLSDDILLYSPGYCVCADCAEFFLKHLKSEVRKQIRLHEAVQPDSTKPSSSSSSSSLASVPADDLSHAVLVSVYPPTTHDVSLPSPSTLLVRLKVTFLNLLMGQFVGSFD